MRLAAVTGCRLHLIRPLGFEMDDARLRRAGMDYRDKAAVTVHDDLDTWRESVAPKRVFALTVDGDIRYDEIGYAADDAVIFGPESEGLPHRVKSLSWVEGLVRIPMVSDVRSINLSNAAAIVVYEAWRQFRFKGSR